MSPVQSCVRDTGGPGVQELAHVEALMRRRTIPGLVIEVTLSDQMSEAYCAQRAKADEQAACRRRARGHRRQSAHSRNPPEESCAPPSQGTRRCRWGGRSAPTTRNGWPVSPNAGFHKR